MTLVETLPLRTVAAVAVDATAEEEEEEVEGNVLPTKD